jgi:hypothetical protein
MQGLESRGVEGAQGPMSQEQPDPYRARTDRRNVISSIFVAVLIGIGFQETVSPVRQSFRGSGVTLATMTLLVVFFLTSLRFFIGNQLHLMNESLMLMPGGMWFYDFSVVVLQCTVLIFLGGNASIEQNEKARIDFIALLIILYCIDIVWIMSQWALGKVKESLQRKFVPWAWCILNTALTASITIIRLLAGDNPYSDIAMVLFLICNLIAFVVDVILVDYYDVI